MHRRRYMALHRKTGLCLWCSRPASGRTSLCDHHREKERQRSAKKKQVFVERYLKEGRCVRCSTPLDPEMDEGMTCCLSCRSHLSQVAHATD
jgi:hypothetical protein